MSKQLDLHVETKDDEVLFAVSLIADNEHYLVRTIFGETLDEFKMAVYSSHREAQVAFQRTINEMRKSIA